MVSEFDLWLISSWKSGEVTNLRKYKYTGYAAARPNTASEQSTHKARISAPPSPSPSESDIQ